MEENQQETVYISGPMTGLPQLNYPAFFAAEKRLSAAGFKVLNPARCLAGTEYEGREQDAPHAFCMRRALALEAQADRIYFLKNWEFSKGAKFEHLVSLTLEIKLLTESALTVMIAQQLSVKDIGCRHCGRTKALTGEAA